jgi:ubiquinone/menaquinone biosynthesis C-methylase UbiE
LFKRDIVLNPKHYVAGLAGSLPFANDIFDIVYSIHCLGKGMDFHMELFRGAVFECLRVLKSGGTLNIYPFIKPTQSIHGANQKNALRDISYTVRRIKGSGLDYPNAISITKP